MTAMRDQRRARILALSLVAVLAAAIVAATRVVGDERTVARAEQRLAAQSRALDAGEHPLPSPLPPPEVGYPARADLADALLLARGAASLPAASRGPLLARATDAARAATAARLRWGEAWAVRAYVESLRHGVGSKEAREALVRSYADAPFLRHSAAWRTQAGFADWDALDTATRNRLVNEAVWLGRIDLSVREQLFGMARASAGYRSFLAQWRARRIVDQDPRPLP